MQYSENPSNPMLLNNKHSRRFSASGDPNSNHEHLPILHDQEPPTTTITTLTLLCRWQWAKTSSPKQRPKPGPRKRLSLNEMMESRSNLSGVTMQRSCSHIQEAINFKNAVMGRLHKSIEFGGREADRNYF